MHELKKMPMHQSKRTGAGWLKHDAGASPRLQPVSPACASLTRMCQSHPHVPVSPTCARSTRWCQPLTHVPVPLACASLTRQPLLREKAGPICGA
jgi:hypothetical protein